MNREEVGLRGPVRTCGTELDYVNHERSWVMHTDDTFSLQGDLLERRHRNPDGSHWSIVCRYDDQGRILEKEQDGPVSERRHLFSYRYDSLGRLERVFERSGSERERVFESIQYAADGTKTRTTYPAPFDESKRRTTSVAASAMLQVSLEAVAIMTVLDSSDRPIRRVFYDVDDRVIRRVAFRYDAVGLLLEEGEVLDGRIREDFRNVYRYDAFGRQMEADQRWGDFGGSRRTFDYNQFGDKVGENILQDTGIFREDDLGSQSWTQRFTYRYDDRDNWTERTTETIPETGGARISMIERRRLSYY